MKFIHRCQLVFSFETILLLVSYPSIFLYDKLCYILAYKAIDIITNNNIQEHFIDHFNKYVNIVFDVKKQRDEITKTN